MILIASFLLQLVMPWWVIIVISFATCGLIGKTPKISLWSPFLAVFLLWTGMALFSSVPNHHLLAGRIADMFGMPAWWTILLLSALLGGLAAGISGFCGYHFRKAALLIRTAPKD